MKAAVKLIQGKHHFSRTEALGSWSGEAFGSASYIRNLCNNGRLDEAFRVVDSMEKKGLPISRDIIYSLLQGCNGKNNLASARKVHSLMVKHGLNSIAPLGDHLIRLFTVCGSLQEANEVFSNIITPSIFTWNSLISAHSKLGESAKALQLYEKLQHEGIMPDRVTFVCMCNACGSVGALIQGTLMHHQAIENALESDIILGNSLIDMYAKCGYLVEARKVFDTHAKRDMVTWAVIISGYAAQGHGLSALEIYRRMHQDGIKPNKVVILCILKACASVGAIRQGQLIHEEILEAGLESDLAIMSSLVDMYAKCGSLVQAGKVFNQLPSRDVVSWGAMIDGYAQNGHGLVALEVFERMLQEGMEPNKVTFLGILKACGSIDATDKGRSTHAQIVKRELETDVAIGSALVDMYAKCKCLEEAYNVFARLANRNVVSWGAIISGFSQCGQAFPALEFFNEMLLEGIEPNRVIFLCILKACSSIEALEQGTLIHGLLLQIGLESDLVIGNTLVDMYAKCGNLEAAHKVFDELSMPDVVSFGALISGYSHQGYGALALDLFGKMQEMGVKPERATFLSLLRACGSMGAARHGKLIHEQIIKHGLDSTPLIRNSLVDMYAKTGRLDEARQIFDDISNQDVVSCGAMIEGYTQQGNCKTATQLLEDMCQAGLKPDTGICASILTACSNAGLLEEGRGFFTSMKENHGIIPTKEHYSCVIDLLGRAGKLHVAEDLLETMPMLPDIIMWTSLLASCRTYSNVELGKRCFGQVVHLDPIDSSGYVLMLNLYADSHKWEDVDKLQQCRTSAGAWKEPGRAWIELNKEINEFLVRSKCHANDLLQVKLMRLNRFMKRQGLVPHLSLVLIE